MPESRPVEPSQIVEMAHHLVSAGVIAVFGLCAFAVMPALAHPHIWVTTRTTVLYENGAIAGLRHAWTFDEYYTVMAIDGLDTNKDGVYSREELAELAKVNVEALKEFGYFTFPKLKGQDLAVGTPKDFFLEHTARKPQPAAASPDAGPAPQRSGADQIAAAAAKPAKELTLHFTLPLAKPVLAEAEGFSFSIGDSSFFIAFEAAATDPAVLGEGAPKGCRIASLAAPSAPDANPSKPGDLMASRPSDLSVNIVSAPGWQVTCGPGG